MFEIDKISSMFKVFHSNSYLCYVSWKHLHMLSHTTSPKGRRTVSNTGLVRMAHASRSTLFRQRLDAAIDSVAKSVARHQVVDLPLKVLRAKAANAHKLQTCCSGISDDNRQLILDVLNDDWNVSLKERGGRLNHFCFPGCCANDKMCQDKTRTALKMSIGSFFDVPLLYRWKHFDPATEFVFRNILIHRLLEFIWEATMSSVLDDTSFELSSFMDADSADLSPAVKQKIRMGKVWHMLTEENMLATRRYHIIYHFLDCLVGFRHVMSLCPVGLLSYSVRVPSH